MDSTKGYKCEFLNSVSDDFFCKKCCLVARRLTVAACCGESFCYACITDIQEQDKGCPECRRKDFSIFEQMKNQKRINSLSVYCTMKERGCEWSGTLEQLDTHLDLNQDNCQYVDTKCPLHCLMAIPKNKVEQHVAQHCTKRPYVCQHCNFKATYEEIVDKHLAECKYVPLQCPNLCGVTFERDFMEDHMKMCRLEEVVCEFRGVGCEDQFTRENQEEHTRQNSHKHLTLTASLAVESKEQLQQKLQELDNKHKNKENRLMEKIVNQENMLHKQEEKLWSQEKEIKELKSKSTQQEKKQKELERKLAEQHKRLDKQSESLREKERKLTDQDQKLKKVEKMLLQTLDEYNQQMNSQLKKLEQQFKQTTDESNDNKQQVTKVATVLPSDQRFEMKRFSIEKGRDIKKAWKSPAMYTDHGYKFCIGVDANGYGEGNGRSVWVDLYTMAGEYDDLLKWPVEVTVTIELINQKGRKNIKCTKTSTWEKHASKYFPVTGFSPLRYGFIDHAALKDFLKYDTLHFYVSEVQVQ